MLIVVVSLWLAASAPAPQGNANVAVVINDDSPASRQVGEYYVKIRQIPETNVIRLNAPVDETVTRAAYTARIEMPIAKTLAERGLQDRVLYIVLTMGVPLRIVGESGANGTSASVDSELTLLYRRLVGGLAPVVGRVDNPFYLKAGAISAARAFSRRDHDIYLVTRLDGFTVADALALVDRSVKASAEGRILLDRRADPAGAVGDRWLGEAAKALADLGQGDRVDLVDRPGAAVKAPLLGYFSWGSNDPANKDRQSSLQFGAGAIAATLAGSDARTLKEPPASWRLGDRASPSTWFAGGPQSLVGDLVREGVSGVAGSIIEPELGSALRPQVLFPAYVSGFNLAESYYLALPDLSWQTVILGDPLCRPFSGRADAPEVDTTVDARTGLPQLFSSRRIEAVGRTMKGSPSHVVAMMVRTEAALRADDRSTARAILEDVVGQAPTLVAPQVMLAQLYEVAGAYDLATARYRRILELEPRHVIALNNLAYALATREGKVADALLLAQTAATLAPRNPEILDTYGWILHLSGDHRGAERHLAQSLRISPDTAETRLHAAVVAAALGDHKGAQVHLDAALRLDDSLAESKDVKDLRAKLLKR